MKQTTHLPRPSTVDETVATIRAQCQPLDAEEVSLDQALGRVLRAPVRSDQDQPPFDRSSVDGYAIRMDDRQATFRIVDRLRAGDWRPRNLQAGEAVQIATGAALPGNGLQVVMKEDARAEGDRLTVAERGPDRNIRFMGEDAKAGSVLLDAGTTLGPGALALMASVGGTQPRVTRLPRVLHLSTGDEIVPPDETPAPGQIRDSNTVLVRAFLSQFGITPRQARVSEERNGIAAAIGTSNSEAGPVNLLLISGGASVGEHDFTRELLEECGYTIHVSRTTTRPGKPLLFGTRGRSAAFGLPGNPLSHFVCLHLYVRQALWRFSGASAAPEFGEGMIAGDVATGASERETLWPARLEFSPDGPSLTLLRWKSSGDLTSLATTNALVRLPPDRPKLCRGMRVAFLPT